MAIESEVDQILNEVKNKFNGRDPIKELNDRIQGMEAPDLRKLVLVSANKIGTAIKGDDYENTLDAAIHINIGADLLMSAYDTAYISALSNTNEGTA